MGLKNFVTRAHHMFSFFKKNNAIYLP